MLRLSWVVAVVAVAAVAALWANTERQQREVLRRELRSETHEEAARLAAGLQAVVDRNIQLVQGLVAVFAFEPSMEQERFARLAVQLLRGDNEVRRITVAPGFVIEQVFPLEGNEGVIGMDFRQMPTVLPSALVARDLRTTVVDGPAPLKHGGGTGLFARSPVFVEGPSGEERFWGLISTVIDAERLFAAAGLDAPDLPVAVALSRRDATDGVPFHGQAAILAADPVVAEIALPHGGWELAAIPRGGWRDPPAPWGLRALFALAALLVAAPILGAGRMAESRRRKLATIREREAELSRLSWRLEFALAGVERRGLGRGPRDRRAAVGRPDARRCSAIQTAPASSARPTGPARCIPTTASARWRRPRPRRETAGRFVTEYRIVRPDGEVRHIRDMARRYEGAGRIAAAGRTGLGRDGGRGAAGGAEPAADGGGGGDPGQVAVPGGDEPRDPDADERRAGAARADARRSRSRTSSAGGRRSRSPRRGACSRS